MNAVDPDRFEPRKISNAASTTIDHWVSLLSNDQLSLTALPAPLFSLYSLGVLDGRQQRAGEVQAAKLEADRLWLLAFGDDDRKQYLLDRLDQAADLSNRPDVDDVLDETWRIFLASLDTIREPVRLNTTEHPRSTHDHAA